MFKHGVMKLGSTPTIKRNGNNLFSLLKANHHVRNIHNHNRHVFALNYNELNGLLENLNVSDPSENTVGITDPSLVRRMTNILRFKQGDQFVLFDLNSSYQLFEVLNVEKRMITAQILPLDDDETTRRILEQRKKFSVTASICMTKSRETFEEMIYQSSSMGVNTIIPLITTTDKKQHAEYFENKRERLLNIMVAAIEQSKQFYGIPKIASPMTIQEYAKTLEESKTVEKRIFLDVEGETPWINLLNDIEKCKLQQSGMNINLLVGPERDLSDQERKFLSDRHFQPMSLSKKIVYKSETAFTISMGSIMSVIWN